MNAGPAPSRSSLPAACRRLRVPRFALGLAACVAAAAWAGACSLRQEPPDVLLVTVDTLRADRLGAYGSTRTRTPAIDRLAAEGALFEQATAPMPVTRPSHFTMFTARYPREHGVTDNHLALPESEQTLAEVFREAGYRTGAFTGVVLLDETSGAAQGFDIFRGPGKQQVRASTVVDRAVEWLRGLDGERPYFLWVHVYDPHMPYAPPEELRAARPEGQPGLETVRWIDLRRLARAQGGDVDEAAYERALELYDGEVDSVDAALGRLFGEAAARESPRGTITAFTADHGECFDHGYFFRHAGCLYEGAMQVPLIIRHPGRVEAGRRIGSQVELRDLAPTLLDLANLDAPESFGGGRALLAHSGDGGDDGGERFALIQHPLSSQALIQGRGGAWRAIETVRGEPMRPVLRGRERVGLKSLRWKYLRTGPDEELYDLFADPQERHDLAPEQPPILRELRRQLHHRLSEHPLTVLDAGEIHPELQKNLRALGYL